MKQAVLFPGQGSQKLGMGLQLAQDFRAAMRVFEEVDEALSLPLSRIMWEGPEEKLHLTENAQPALMAVSMATLEVLKCEGGFDLASQSAFVAGHSLGEYSALAAVGVFSLRETARLLRLRGQAMQRAVSPEEGAMAAVLGLEVDVVAKIAAQAAGEEICVVANDNAPRQSVMSGHKEAINRAKALAKDCGARRIIPLVVSAPFHCPLMAPASEEMRAALQTSEIRAPNLPVISNVLAEPTSDPSVILDLLPKQITATVRWRESMAYLERKDVETVVEIGAGSVLTGLARQCCPEIRGTALGTSEEIRDFLSFL